MDRITNAQFEAAKDLKPTLKENAKIEDLSEAEFDKLLKDMQNPVRFQKELAIKVKVALDNRIKREMDSKGELSDYTRRWVESYGKILEKIQSAIYGDKSVNLHLHKVSHSDISDKIRESNISEIEMSPVGDKNKIKVKD